MTNRNDLSSLRVLIVDDNRYMRDLMQDVLLAFKIRDICKADDVPKAFQELKYFAADIILTDWHMEPLDGVEFVQLVRNANDSPNPYVPIVMVTGFSEAERVWQARDAGVNEFLVKPLSAKSIYSRIISIIDRPRPFVRTKDFFGPDRRRQNLGPPPQVAERREDELEKLLELGRA